MDTNISDIDIMYIDRKIREGFQQGTTSLTHKKKRMKEFETILAGTKSSWNLGGSSATTDRGSSATRSSATTDRGSSATTDRGSSATTDRGSSATTDRGSSATTDRGSSATRSSATTDRGSSATTDRGSSATTDRGSSATTDRTRDLKKLPDRIRISIEKNIQELREEIQKIEEKIDLNFYISETAEILREYREILKTPIRTSFMKGSTSESGETNRVKEKLVEKYLEIVQPYYQYHKILPKFPEKKFKMTCSTCPNEKNFFIEENAYICQECYTQQVKLEHTTSYKDVDRINISTKYTYDRKVHFRDCMNQYQGKQNCTIEDKIYTDLEDILERHHLLVGNKNTPKEVRYGKITKNHIFMFLKELDYSKQYENVVLIHYNLTGKKPDDISHLEEKLLSDFDILIETYDKYFKGDISRVNFISTQYVLYQLLQKYKHPCRKEDFMILKTVERKSFHDNICKELFEKLGWSFTPIY